MFFHPIRLHMKNKLDRLVTAIDYKMYTNFYTHLTVHNTVRDDGGASSLVKKDCSGLGKSVKLFEFSFTALKKKNYGFDRQNRCTHKHMCVSALSMWQWQKCGIVKMSIGDTNSKRHEKVEIHSRWLVTYHPLCVSARQISWLPKSLKTTASKDVC